MKYSYFACLSLMSIYFNGSTQVSFCPNNNWFVPDTSTCFWRTNTIQNAEMSNEVCRVNFGYLAVLRDSSTTTSLSSRYTEISTADYFIGVKKYDLSTVNDRYVSWEGVTEDWTNWDSSETMYANMCTLIYPMNGYVWRLEECSNSHYGLCYKQLDLCPSGSMYVPDYRVCYWIISSKQIAETSNKLCTDSGGHLATIIDETVNRYLIDNYDVTHFQSLQNPLWIGIWYDASAERYVHRDGSGSSWSNYNRKRRRRKKRSSESGSDEAPTDRCTVMDTGKTGYTWSEISCTKKRAALCYKTIAETPGTAAPTTGISTPATPDTAAAATSSISTEEGFSTLTVLNTSSECCECPLYPTYDEYSLKLRLQELQRELLVNKKETQAYLRRYSCDPDDRLSAKAIGFVGVAVLVSVLSVFVILDIDIFIRYGRQMYKSIL